MSTYEFKNVRLSLEDLTGSEYIKAVCAARNVLSGESSDELMKKAEEKVDFYPEAFQNQLKQLIGRTGEQVCEPFSSGKSGAGSSAFNSATKTERAPLSAMGYYRIGEDGRLYQATKSAHYHTPIGHNFPGYRLCETARSLGIPNATHNNTRGFITRKLEEELIKAADCKTLDSVLNLETGSLAVEAALKMALARFYRSQTTDPDPECKGLVPVIIVVGNDFGGLQANYHGTTTLTQTLRGMWDGMLEKIEEADLYLVRSVRPNNIEDLDKVFSEFNSGKYRVAAFFHEIVMMNYLGKVLTPEFLKHAYALCEECGAAKIDDEIQSCLWHHDFFMFKEWGLEPDFVAVGKGFPGGEYPASRIIFNSKFDTLPQFGALVTNGQEEIASLAYLVTMAWAQANKDVTKALGEYFENGIHDLAEKHSGLVEGVNGKRHMLGISFRDVKQAREAAGLLNSQGYDISVQDYKTEVPPAALLKIPLIMDKTAIDNLLSRIEKALIEVDK